MRPSVLLGAGLLMAGWSTPNLFPEPVTAGGGGGRFFTGSSTDAFGCDVCHRGGARPAIELRGLPQRYDAGETYTLEVRWTAGDSVSLLGEFVDELGDGVGRITLPASDIILDEERCSSGTAALDLHASDHDRSIFGMPACGATLARLQWTAPQTPSGVVYLHLAAVRSDDSDDPDGDGVTMLVEALPSAETPETANCSVAGTDRALLLLLLVPLLRRRRTAPPSAMRR